MTASTRLDWTHDPAGQTYLLSQASCHAKVWCSTLDQWAASVSYLGVSIGQQGFRTARDAQAWCEARLTEFVAGGHRTTRSGVPPAR